jgi:Glu-tRNA(Gln) amidotransferase subunit E-like FAD-binding protein
MGRRKHGSIHDLPEHIKKDINALLIENKTYADIVAFVKKHHGVDLTDSSLSRYNKEFMEELKLTRILQEQAAWLNDDPEKALVLEKLTATMITRRLATALQEGDFKVVDNAKLIDAFAKLQASSTKRAAFEEEIKKKIAKTAEDVSKIAKKSGLSDDAASQIRAKILGIVK